VSDNGLPDTVKVLIGNKTDLEASRQIPKDHGKVLARKLGMSFFETSAKDSYNVEAAFRTLAAKILETDSLIKSIESKKKSQTVRLKSVDESSDGVFTACSQSLLWVKNGFNATVNNVKSGWKRTRSSR
jgi:GTPase SAR1 family protein